MTLAEWWKHPTAVPTVVNCQDHWGLVLLTLTLIRASARALEGFCARVGHNLFSRLFLHTGQEYMLSDSYMASSLEHLHSCKSGIMLARVTPVLPPLISIPFSLHFILSILKELDLSHMRWRPSLSSSKEASTMDSKPSHAVEKWGNCGAKLLSQFTKTLDWLTRKLCHP